MHNSNDSVPLANSGLTRRIGYGVSSTPFLSSTPPAQSTFFSPTRISPLRHPPRYCLSTTNLTQSPVTPVNPTRPIQQSSGPLLVSTKFNVNLRTYIDAQSPGLVSRIVQYDKEAQEKHAPTHQAKYGHPGIFPVVHFFKKDIPVIIPKRVTVRLAPPDGDPYGMSKYSRVLSNEASSDKRNGLDSDEKQASSTKSVLDALKEISRKRIHTSADFKLNQEGDNKRQRVDCIDNTFENNKRAREKSPVQEPTSTSQSNPKKICVVDVLAASYTSSNLLKERLKKGLKRRIELEESQKKKLKEIKFNNAETQTQIAGDETDALKKLKEDLTTVKPSESELSDSEIQKVQVQNNPRTHIRIFDQKRLEINRKNKLAILLSAFTGEPPNLIPHESCSKQQKEEYKLSSILSPPNKPKHDKHVSFNLPSQEEEEVMAKISTTTVVSDISEVKSSMSSTSEAPYTKSSTQVTNTLLSPMISSTVSVGGVVVKPQNATVINTRTSAPQEPVTTPPPKSLGGFKFDLSKTSTSNSFPFGLKQNKVASPTTTSEASGNPFGVASKASEAFHFVSKSNVFVGEERGDHTVPSTSSNSENAATIPSPVTPSAASSTAVTSPYSLTSNFGSKTSTAALSTLTVLFPSTPKFTAATTTSIFGGTPTSSTVCGATPATTATFNFSVPTLASKTTCNIVTSIAPLQFSTTTLASNFDTTTTSPGLFSAVSSISSSYFGATMTTSTSTIRGVTTTTSTPIFPVTTVTSSPMLGTATNASTSVFGTATNKLTSAFGTANTSTSAFGTANTSTSAFGTATNTSTSIFGTATNTPTSVFRTAKNTSTSAFGTAMNSSTSAFGTTASTSSPMFCTTMGTSTSMFGTTTTNTSAPTFGATTSSATSIFGSTTSTSALKFGTTTTASIFGSATTSTSTPSFSTTPTTAFNGVPNFAPGFNSPGNFNSPNSLATTITSATTSAPPTFMNSTFGAAPATSFSGDDVMFGTPTSTGGTPKPTFGFPSSTSLAFKANQVTTFGANQQVTSAPSNFTLKASVTSAPSFGTNSPFAINPAATSTASSFGGAPFGSNVATPSTSTSIFGTNSAPFNLNVSNVTPGNFGGSSTFSPGGAPAFGTPVTTSNSEFGTSKLFRFTPNNFASNPSTSFNFNSSTSSTSIFNSPKTSIFDASPNQNVSFGGSSAMQEQISPFERQDPNAFVFRPSPGNFGNKGPAIDIFNSFGDSSETFTLGEAQNVGGFDDPNTFKFQYNNALPYDVNNANNTSGGNLFNFGSNNQASTPASGLFTFGSQGEAQKPNFSFSGGSLGRASPGFGNNFGASPAGMFSIGSGPSTPGRSRTQLKVKRRN